MSDPLHFVKEASGVNLGIAWRNYGELLRTSWLILTIPVPCVTLCHASSRFFGFRAIQIMS